MTKQHPITPPTELVQQWITEGRYQDYCSTTEYAITQAARWGADQELLACGNYLKQCAQWEEEDVTEFYNYRRPKPLSLKEQALQALNDAVEMADDVPPEGICSDQANIIRRALEQLDD